ncbi:hypothetical protein ACFL5Z_10630, partial [Planctomycetota bacterium]
RNPYSGCLNLLLLLSAIMTGSAAVIEGSRLWKGTEKPRLVILFVLSLIAMVASATGIYVKSENERFYEEDRNEYTSLSLKMDAVIRNFYFEFRKSQVSDSTISDPIVREKFLELSGRTFTELEKLRTSYAENYNLPTNL